MRQMRLTICLITVIAMITLTGCLQSTAPATESGPELTVYTSFYPLYDFANKIGGSQVHVLNLLPPGVEPHDWEPTTQAMTQLHNADLLLINGLEMEPWIDKIVDSLDGNIKVINTSEGISPLTGYAGHGHDDDDENEQDDHDGALPDPHVWLDPILALHQAEQIALALIDSDPEHEGEYHNNLLAFRIQIEKLDTEYREVLSSLPRHEFIVTHLSFAYMAERYGLEQVGISGLSPHAEPSPSELTHLIDFAKEHNIRYIFQEPLVTSRLAEVLAQDIGAETLELNPLEGLTDAQLAAGDDYFTIMYRNLEQLKVALAE